MLDLDPQQVMFSYAEGGQTQLIQKSNEARPMEKRNKRDGSKSKDAVKGILIGLILVFDGFWCFFNQAASVLGMLTTLLQWFFKGFCWCSPGYGRGFDPQPQWDMIDSMSGKKPRYFLFV